ncbi:hypothetical protein PACTADRAFT_83939 [Pachysolen tannophilus NRRL Y-2460]|uniref:Uncharacterized protein n=1 Tax=Pachysolen tannophilus NRRL Y-2460 TaxID=669874 RepID=A0A1E4TXZ8_PACTA|nr:hypothetical protein PACTADRAFT_83939 [Pachysolen tannophilus NRRL Y-2460]
MNRVEKIEMIAFIRRAINYFNLFYFNVLYCILYIFCVELDIFPEAIRVSLYRFLN